MDVLGEFAERNAPREMAAAFRFRDAQTENFSKLFLSPNENNRLAGARHLQCPPTRPAFDTRHSCRTRPSKLMQLTNHPGDVLDADLIAAARSGDREARGMIYSSHWNYLLLVVGQRMSGDWQSKVGASDIVQQSMLEAHQSFDQFRGDNQRQLRAWLAQIVRRNVLDHSRSFGNARRRSVATREVPWSDAIESSLVAAGESPSGLIRQAEIDQELINAMALLPPRYRRVIEMRHRDGLAYAEIAMRCSISVEAARKLWTRAIRQLQQFLGTAHEGQRIRCQ